MIWKHIIERNSFGHTSTSTKTSVTIVFNDKRKVIYMLNKANDIGHNLEKNDILKRKFEEGGSAEVIVSKDKPFTLNIALRKRPLQLHCIMAIGILMESHSTEHICS